MIVCYLNFGPIRNTVILYIANLPDHMRELSRPLCDYIAHWTLKQADQSDQRQNIVEAENQESSRHEVVSVVMQAASPVIICKECKPNIVGKRESAVSPSNSYHGSASVDLPEVQC